mgnify:CR=1 FL=1
MNNSIKPKFSKGFLRDLSALHLAVGILAVAKEKEMSVRHNTNKNYRINKRIYC